MNRSVYKYEYVVLLSFQKGAIRGHLLTALENFGSPFCTNGEGEEEEGFHSFHAGGSANAKAGLPPTAAAALIMIKILRCRRIPHFGLLSWRL